MVRLLALKIRTRNVLLPFEWFCDTDIKCFLSIKLKEDIKIRYG